MMSSRCSTELSERGKLSLSLSETFAAGKARSLWTTT